MQDVCSDTARTKLRVSNLLLDVAWNSGVDSNILRRKGFLSSSFRHLLPRPLYSIPWGCNLHLLGVGISPPCPSPRAHALG